jgi:hypothetical protein
VSFDGQCRQFKALVDEGQLPADLSNPFVVGRHGSRDEVIAKYRAWIAQQPALMAALHELREKDLVCWCLC